MSKRIICDIAFFLVFIIAFAFYIGGHNFNIENGFAITCLLVAFFLIIVCYIRYILFSIKDKIFLFVAFILFITVISYVFIEYKEDVLESYFSKQNVIEGIIYFDDPVHKKNANLLIKLDSKSGIKLSYKIRIYDNKSHLENVSEGSSVLVKFAVLDTKDKSNYGEFDYKNYLKGSGIARTLIVKDLVEKSITVDSKVYFYREKILYKMYDDMLYITKDREKAEFIYALISGSKSGVDKDLIEMFKITATIHLLTVSGFHFGIIYMCLERFMWFLKVPRNIKLALLMFVMTIYYIITPMKFSCLRALVMIIILIISKILNRQFDFMCALSFVVILSLVLNPYVLYDLSFVLTYLACIGIGVVYKYFSQIEKYACKFPNVIRKIISIFILSISIQISLMLYFLLASSDINLIGALINIPLSFSISILMMVLIPCFLFIKFEFIKDINEVFNVVNFIVEQIYNQIGYFSNIGLFIYSISDYKYFMFPLILTLILTIYLKQNVEKLKKLDIIVVLSLALILIVIAINIAKLDKKLEIIFNDVGQGDSAMIITENGKSILIDLGDGKVDVSTLGKAYGIEMIDVLIFSHGHADHIGGDKDWSKEISADLIIAPFHMKDALSGKSGEIYIVDKRIKFEIDSLKIDIMPIYLDEDNLNESGIIVKLTKENLDVLFTGDIEEETEKLLQGSDILKSIDILKVPHHGSKTSSTEQFVSSVSPLYAVVAVGENRYGHPNVDVLARYEELASNIIILKDYGQTKFTYKDDSLTFKSYFKVEK
ncbi:MAG: DNA internalization-related competence protein ComEC/Rec2 [Acidaminobacteraceae bacterium]